MIDKKIDKIKKTESPPKVIEDFISRKKIEELLNLYNSLPLTVHNKKQNVKKKRWIKNFNKNLDEWYYKKLYEIQFNKEK